MLFLLVTTASKYKSKHRSLPADYKFHAVSDEVWFSPEYTKVVTKCIAQVSSQWNKKWMNMFEATNLPWERRTRDTTHLNVCSPIPLAGKSCFPSFSWRWEGRCTEVGTVVFPTSRGRKDFKAVFLKLSRAHRSPATSFRCRFSFRVSQGETWDSAFLTGFPVM